MDVLLEYLFILIPIFVIQIALMITALVHILKHDNYKTGNRTIWVVIVILINIIGPILYFTIGKGDE